MPEEIPAVEDIKHARKRLETLEYHTPEKLENPEIILEDLESQEKVIPLYKLPDNIEKINELINIIQSFP